MSAAKKRKIGEECHFLMTNGLLSTASQTLMWCPCKKGDIEIIEKVQKRATKLIISLKHLSYSERLKQLKLPTLKYRRLHGDMTEVFQTVHKYYDVCAVVKL